VPKFLCKLGRCRIIHGTERTYYLHLEKEHKDVYDSLTSVWVDREIEKIIGKKKTGESVTLAEAL
jgi:hypothetical protein